MAGETIITVIGNLTDDPELRFTPSGAAVANFTVASTPRSFNKQTNAWEDGETLFLRCSIWRQAAENVAESLTRGTRVIVQGRLVSRSYEDREGQKRTVNELQVDEIGPSLTWATAKVARAQRSGGNSGGGFGGGNAGGNTGGNAGGGFGGGNGGGYGGGQTAPAAQSAPAGDPWATPSQGGQSAPAGDPWGAPGVGSDEPPF